ncbi:DUF1294 domain-containing protein [Clostridiales bacterium F-3ap]|uniref:DUF1294 domain-containing protein n=2 Tax=Anaerotalea alkaliphila TaxID=2662126 RepID=A0A7X5HVH0_9FIRM|nr:DUF1294 domain-containing protein [Anaerotalea alkaliphila]
MDALSYGLLAANLASFLLYGTDKWKARRGAWRIPESRLLQAAFLAPFGASTGMLLFRHKIRNRKFLFLVPAFTLLQLMIFYYFF